MVSVQGIGCGFLREKELGTGRLSEGEAASAASAKAGLRTAEIRGFMCLAQIKGSLGRVVSHHHHVLLLRENHRKPANP